MPAHNQQAMPVQNAAPVAAVVEANLEENKYITIKPIIGTFIENHPENVLMFKRSIFFFLKIFNEYGRNGQKIYVRHEF
jgi:hypothetical protein